MDNQLRQDALQCYDRTTKVLEAMFASWKETFEKNFDVRIGLNCFDALLQYSMLQVALNDGNLHVEELKFIRDISKFCNICDYFNQRGYKNVEWQTILNTNESTLVSILEGLQEDIIKVSMDFINIFSFADATIKDHNFLEDLKNDICHILVAVAAADGHADKSEFDWCIIFASLNEITRRKAEFEKANVTGTGSTGDGTTGVGNTIGSSEGIGEKTETRKTLKDFYVKKK